MAEPKYALARVHDAARGSQLEFDIKRARSELVLFVDNLTDGYRFAAALLLKLQPGDYCESVELGPPQAGIYDVYGICISEKLATEFGVTRWWYVKFKLLQSELTGDFVFFVSLHLLNRSMPRKGGVLNPG